MRALLLLPIAALLLTVTPVESHTSTWTAQYVANPLTQSGPHFWYGDSSGGFGLAPAVGGVVFVPHNHTTTLSVTVNDRAYGAIDATICESLNGNSRCSAADGDRVACVSGGSITGFTVGAGNVVVVKVFPPGYVVEGCGTLARGTTGTITGTFG